MSFADCVSCGITNDCSEELENLKHPSQQRNDFQEKLIRFFESNFLICYKPNIRRIRLWRLWTGNHTIFCNGKFLTGPDRITLFITWLLVVVPFILFLGFVNIDMAITFPYTGIPLLFISLCIGFTTILFLFLTSCYVEPGIIVPAPSKWKLNWRQIFEYRYGTSDKKMSTSTSSMETQATSNAPTLDSLENGLDGQTTSMDHHHSDQDDEESHLQPNPPSEDTALNKSRTVASAVKKQKNRLLSTNSSSAYISDTEDIPVYSDTNIDDEEEEGENALEEEEEEDVFASQHDFSTAYQNNEVLPTTVPSISTFQTPSSNTLMHDKQVLINGIPVKLKYCKTCHIYRPPRAVHCKSCGVCINRFDHHCPWIGTCVGERNYRFFYGFLTSCCIACLYGIAVCIAQLVLVIVTNYLHANSSSSGTTPVTESGYILNGALRSIAPILIGLYGCAMLFSVGMLFSYHTYLICVNQTTNENAKRSFSKSKNPFHLGVVQNVKSILFGKIPPSQIQLSQIVNALQ